MAWGSPIPHRSWQVPRAEQPENDKLGWLNESIQESENSKKSQRGYTDPQRSLDLLTGQQRSRVGAPGDIYAEYRARLTSGRLKTNVKTIIAGLSDIRPIGGFHAPKAFSSFANMMNKGVRAMYLQNNWSGSIKEVLGWAAGTKKGFMRPVYRRNFAGQGKGNIYLDTYGWPSICPVQLPQDGDLNNAYSVTLLDELPIWQAHGMFPTYQDRLKPTNSRYWYSAEIRGAATQNATRRLFGEPRRRDEVAPSDLYIPVRWTRVNDLSINETSQTIPMGEPGSTWYYEVPGYGQIKPDGTRADEHDARLYPRGRMIISSQDCVMYDGPCFNWCPDLDLIPFTLDLTFPWMVLGSGITDDAWSLQAALDRILQGSMKRIEAQQNMPLGYNINAVTEKEAKDFDPFDATSTRVGFDGDEVDKPFTNLVPDEVYHIRPEVLELYKELKDALDYLHQMRDIVELSKARALGKDQDMLEKALSSLGPIVKSVSGDMEASVCKVWKQIGWLMLQYLPPARIAKMVGVENMPEEVYDYDPGSLVPSHLQDEFPHGDEAKQLGLSEDDPDGIWKHLRAKDSKYTKIQRAMWMAENVGMTLVPHSLHELHQMQHVLLLLQFKQRNAPVPWCDIMSASNVPDVEIENGNSIQERAQAEKEREITEAARLKAVVEGLGLGDPSGGGGAPGKQKSGGGPNGRPPTASAPPHLKSKDGGARTIVAESH